MNITNSVVTVTMLLLGQWCPVKICCNYFHIFSFSFWHTDRTSARPPTSVSTVFTPLASSSLSYSFSPSSCWLTPSPHFLFTILSIIRPTLAFLLNHVYIILLFHFSLWPSQGSSNKTADIPPFFSLFSSPPAFLHLSELNVWNCRKSIWGLRDQRCKTHPGRISSSSSTRNRNPRPSPRI